MNKILIRKLLRALFLNIWKEKTPHSQNKSMENSIPKDKAAPLMDQPCLAPQSISQYPELSQYYWNIFFFASGQSKIRKQMHLEKYNVYENGTANV